MGIAGAAFHWSPDEFWSCTPHEFAATVEGWEEVNGSGDT